MQGLSVKILDRLLGREMFALAADSIFFAPDVIDQSVGSSVQLTITHRALKTPIFLEALTAWRRVATTPAGRKGTGFRIMSHHLDRFHFLKRCEARESIMDLRSHVRFPSCEKVIVLLGPVKRSTSRFVHGTLSDLSVEGSLLTTASPIDLHESELSVELSTAPGLPVRGLIAWRMGGRTGIKLAGNSPDTLAAWRKLIDRVGHSATP